MLTCCIMAYIKWEPHTQCAANGIRRILDGSQPCILISLECGYCHDPHICTCCGPCRLRTDPADLADTLQVMERDDIAATLKLPEIGESPA